MKYNKPVYILFFELGILLLPYDAIKVMPSTYSPISVYPFSISLFIYLVFNRGKLIANKLSRKILKIFFYVVVISIITSNIYVGSYKFYIQFIFAFSIGLVCYFSVVNACAYYKSKYTQENFFDHTFILISKAYYIPIAVGFLELAAMNGIIPYNIKLLTNSIFGGWQDRLCMTTLEASWVSMHMLILIGVSYYLFSKYKRIKYGLQFLIGMFFFFVSASLQGIATLALAAFIFLLFIQIKNNSVGKFLKNIIISLGIITIVLYIFYKILLLNPSSYYASRILYFTSLSRLLRTDSSSFIRIGYLLLHLLIFRDHFIVGVGGGSFNYVFADYACKYFPKSVHLPEVAAHINMKDAGTPISVYFSILSEFGIVGLIAFGSFLKGSIQQVRNMSVSNEKGVLVFFAICLSLPIQFGSWAYVPWWFALAVLSTIDKSWSIPSGNKS